MTDAAPCVVYGSHQRVTCSCSGGSEASPGSPCEGGSGGDVCSSGRDARALESDVLQVNARAERVCKRATHPPALQGAGLLARAMSVDILTSNYKAPEVRCTAPVFVSFITVSSLGLFTLL